MKGAYVGSFQHLDWTNLEQVKAVADALRSPTYPIIIGKHPDRKSYNIFLSEEQCKAHGCEVIRG